MSFLNIPNVSLSKKQEFITWIFCPLYSMVHNIEPYEPVKLIDLNVTCNND